MKKGTIILLVILGVAAIFGAWYFFFRTPESTTMESEVNEIPDEVMKQAANFEDGEAFRFGGLVYVKTGDTWVVA